MVTPKLYTILGIFFRVILNMYAFLPQIMNVVQRNLINTEEKKPSITKCSF